MRAVVLAACLALTAAPALALSCLPADIARDYQRAEDDDEAWIVVTGKLTFDEAQLPEVEMNRQQETPPETDIPASIAGGSLGPEGFTRSFTRDITLRALCFGQWCGAAESGGDVLAFLKQDGTDYVAIALPCPGMLYADPTSEMLETVTRCFNDGVCTPKIGR